MSTQRTFAGLAWSQKGKVTRREQFLAEMDRVIPWKQLLAVIEPYYPKAGKGRQPLGLEKMLRIYFLQLWFNLSDPQAEDAIYDSESMRRFAGVELSEDVVPDETTILRFRHLLEEHHLTAAIFAAVRDLLSEKRLLVQSGTIVDATIIAAPSSTKNAAQARDPEMRQTRKGNTWFFGMKRHVGTRAGSCTVSRRPMRRRRTSRSCRRSCTARSAPSTGIGPTGARGCARRSGAAAYGFACSAAGRRRPR